MEYSREDYREVYNTKRERTRRRSPLVLAMQIVAAAGIAYLFALLVLSLEKPIPQGMPAAERRFDGSPLKTTWVQQSGADKDGVPEVRYDRDNGAGDLTRRRK